MVKFLVEQGADITIKDKYGNRPYTLAIQSNNTEMDEYIKMFEPKEFHDLEIKKQALKSYKLPGSLVDFLNGDELTVEIHDKYCKFLRFYSYMDTRRKSSAFGHQTLLISYHRINHKKM